MIEALARLEPPTEQPEISAEIPDWSRERKRLFEWSPARSLLAVGGVSEELGLPVLEGHNDVGAGAKILGPVRIGRHARIGANAVVLRDVPPYATAVGVPARIVTRHGFAPAGRVLPRLNLR